MVDTTPPVISLDGDNPLVVECGDGYLEPGATAEDVCDGDLTGSIVIGLATQDIAENAIAELEMDGLRFRAPVFHDDSLTAYTEVLGVSDADRDDAGVVHFKHWGAKQDGTVVFEGERKVLIKRRSHWAGR